MIRIGHGYDVHKLVEGRRLVLGGVEIPYEKGLLGHSDADVLAHAVADALLGALALPDIGRRFPDKDPKYKDADSIELLKADLIHTAILHSRRAFDLPRPRQHQGDHRGRSRTSWRRNRCSCGCSFGKMIFKSGRNAAFIFLTILPSSLCDYTSLCAKEAF